MKKYIFMALAAAGLMLTGCENDFDAKIYGTLSTTNFPSTADDYQNLMMDCYEPFTVAWGYSFNNVNQHNFYVPEGGVWRYFDVTTDEMMPWVNGGTWGGPWIWYSSAQFEDCKNVGRGSDANPNHYEKIREVTRFTHIIDMLEKADEKNLPAAKRDEFLGEARLCRGLLMYYLLNIYGPVPVILDASKIGDNDAEAAMERPSLDDMTKYITDDLEYAASHVAETQAEQGRYTADYARVCLMRHYLNEGYHTEGYYQKAYDLFSKFTGNYILYTDGENPYADQFKIAHKFNSEVIMAVACSENATGNGKEGNFNPFSWYALPYDVAKYDDKGNASPFVKQGGGWGETMNVAKSFYDTFEPGDKRAETIVTSYYSFIHNDWVTEKDLGNFWDGYLINKYPIETATSFQGTDIPLARWADVLLMYAEADVRLHKTVSASAIKCVNEVRHRAGLADLTADKTASVDAFMDALLAERGHELYYEGLRKIDLIRFNKYYTTLTKMGKTPSSEYVPLPDYAVNQAKERGYNLEQYFTRDNYDGPKK